MEIGALPVYDDVKEFMASNQRKLGEGWSSIKLTSAETLLRREIMKSSESSERSYGFGQMQSRKPDESVFVTQKGNAVGGGTNNVLNALAAYLRYLEGTARDDWQEYVVTTCFLCFFFVGKYLKWSGGWNKNKKSEKN